MSKAHTNMCQSYCGKQTIDTNTYGKSTGHTGSYSTNYQIAGRELLTPDEVRMIPNENALLFIRGEKPIIDKKYNTFEHPNFKYTEDGGYEPYIRKLKNASSNISILKNEDIEISNIKDIEEFVPQNIDDYEILVDDEIDLYFENDNK